MNDVIFSGAQPTGVLHLGNYLGAILQWRDLQHQFPVNFFMLADLHAITVPYDFIHFHSTVVSNAAQYLACGIDPKLSSIFVQSDVENHAYLTWMLSAITPLSWLDKMVQFKEKAKDNKEKSSVGLYTYPILMAADIMLYKSTKVPVGDDQAQHLELAKSIAERFNRIYGVNYFSVPMAVNSGTTARIMDLKDPLKKMSKSAINDNSRINLLDHADKISKKIMSATTDSFIGFDYETLKTRPAAYNLINIYSMLTGLSLRTASGEFSTFSELKSTLIEVLIAALTPIQKRFYELMNDRQYVLDVLGTGACKAREVSSTNIKEIKKIMGFTL